MGGLPGDKDAKKCLKALQKNFGWKYSPDEGDGGHGVGRLTCGKGCSFPVWGTTKRNQARAIWRLANKCSHGKAPKREHW